MNVLIINGSPRKDGNCSIAINEMIKVFDRENIEHEIVDIGAMDIRGCIACNYCKENGKCVFNDIVNETAKKLDAADGIVIASPVYYASAAGTLISFIDRLFYSSKSIDKTMKVGACIAAARRGGASATFDELNKYFAISNMPIAPSQYWNSIHGLANGEAEQDEEGKQTMRTLAQNMVFLMKSIALGKEQYGLPEYEEKVATNFIR